ncbi:MAG: NADH-quinone oxidoreductase subunit NuoE [Oscillospiraceae bacterium]|nr:NADH-quinone oxidoreductase subunit NuoE [Oscillospiraceae bacterium]
MENIDFTLMDPVFEKHEGEEGALIAVLQEAQALYGWLPPELLSYVAEKTGVPPAKVMGVVTFYAQFRLKPVGKYLISLCQGTACHVNGSVEIEKAIGDYLGVKEGEITADGLFTCNSVACLGCCSLSPAMMINSKVYGNLTGAKATEILEKIRAGEGAK